MKNTLTVTALAALATMFVGCKSIPTTDSMYVTAKAIGVASGMVANQTKIDDTSRNAVIDIMNEVDNYVPATNSTFEAAWTPIAEAHTKKLVDEGKIDTKQAEIILCAFKTVTKGMDYLLDVRCPKARQYQDLVEAAIHGFTSGFLTVFRPANSMSVSPDALRYDAAAYDYLSK